MSLKIKQKECSQSRERNSESECIELLRNPKDGDLKTDSKFDGENNERKSSTIVKIRSCWKCGKLHAGTCPVSSK